MKHLPGSEIPWPRKVRTPAEAVRFIDATGFCMLFPVKNVALPSLYYAVTRRHRPRWDGETEKLWGWKDELPRRRRAFYAKYFKTRGTFVSRGMLPYLLASRGAATAPGDHERFYAAGRITHDAHAIWQALAKHGPMATLELRHACKMESKAGNRRYKQAMLELQCLLQVVHFGTEKETAAWPSSRFELTSRAFPKAVVRARKLDPSSARRTLAAKYLHWFPDAQPIQVARLFGWSKGEAFAAIGRRAGQAPPLHPSKARTK